MKPVNQIILKLVVLLGIVVILGTMYRTLEGFRGKSPAQQLKDYNSNLNYAKANKDSANTKLSKASQAYSTDMTNLLHMINKAKANKIYDPRTYDVYDALKNIRDMKYKLITAYTKEDIKKINDKLNGYIKDYNNALKPIKDKAMIDLIKKIYTTRINDIITNQKEVNKINGFLATMPKQIADLIKKYPYLAPKPPLVPNASSSSSVPNPPLTGFGASSTIQGSGPANLAQGQGSSILQNVPGFPEYQFKGCWTKGNDTTYPILNAMAVPKVDTIEQCAEKAKALNLSTIAYDGSSTGMCFGGESEYKNTTTAQCYNTYKLGKSFAVYSKIP